MQEKEPKSLEGLIGQIVQNRNEEEQRILEEALTKKRQEEKERARQIRVINKNREILKKGPIGKKLIQHTAFINHAFPGSILYYKGIAPGLFTTSDESNLVLEIPYIDPNRYSRKGELARENEIMRFFIKREVDGSNEILGIRPIYEKIDYASHGNESWVSYVTIGEREIVPLEEFTEIAEALILKRINKIQDILPLTKDDIRRRFKYYREEIPNFWNNRLYPQPK